MWDSNLRLWVGTLEDAYYCHEEYVEDFISGEVEISQ